MIETYVVEVASRATLSHTQSLLDQAKASDPIQQAFHTRFAMAFAQYRIEYDKLYDRADVKPFEENITSSVRVEDGAIVLDALAEPFSVHLFRIEH